jgi:type VI protein secretion system component VasF
LEEERGQAVVYRQPIEMIDGLAVSLWEAIDKWAAIPTTEGTLSQRIAAAAEVERVVAEALGVQKLIDARMGLDMLAHRLRDGGPETPRDEVRKRVIWAAEKINEIVPRSPLR